MHLTFILSAALITAQPLADGSDLEPSVQNEVDHALARAATNEIPVTSASVAFAAFYATNGWSVSQTAIGLVSSQKDGRWFYRGADVTPAAVRILNRLSGYPQPPLKVSVFSNHIEEIARQEKIPFEDAARKVRSLGISGVDAMWGLSPERFAILGKCGFQVATVIGWPSFDRGSDETSCEQYLELARAHACRQVMLVPGFAPEGREQSAVFRSLAEKTERFARNAAPRGVSVCVEDFDSASAPTWGRDRTRAFFAAAPSVGFVYDTGNFNGPGERSENGLEFLDRVRHFHLKDRSSSESGVSVAVGSGVMPIAKLVTAALDAGYGGWFTIEHFGATNMLETVAASARFVNSLN